MSGEDRREARLAAARAEFAASPAPPTLGWWPCPRDPGQFRYYDGIGWTDRTREPAMRPGEKRAVLRKRRTRGWS